LLAEIPRKDPQAAVEAGIRCSKCGSPDVWKWGRTRGWRRFLADALHKRWLKCRNCGGRFMAPLVAADPEEEEAA